MTKRCKVCNIEKPISEFHKMKGCLYGVRTICKECRKIERKEYSKLPHVVEKNKNMLELLLLIISEILRIRSLESLALKIF